MMLKTSPFFQTAAEAENKADEIKVLCQKLAAAMQSIHGGTWRFDVNHEIGWAMVRQN